MGGGKSHAIRWDLISWCLSVPGINCMLFRRTLGELEENHIEQIQDEIPPELGTYNVTKNTFRFYNGSRIKFAYCEKEQDVKRYQGAEIHVLGVDEAAHLTQFQLSYLIGRCRLGKFKGDVPEKYRHLLPRAVFGSNPGGPGHSFLKRQFIDRSPPLELFRNTQFKDPDNPKDEGRLSIYIPARMADNQFIDEDYSGGLFGLPPEMVEAYKNGDWDAVVGQALPVTRIRHGLRPFKPPGFWTHFMSIDWGTGKPFSIGWYAVSDGAILEAKHGEPERYIPPGAIVRYAEWYGWNGEDNKGCRMDSRQVARGIMEREAERGDPPMDYRIGDSGMWAQHDGPSPAENMLQESGGRISLRMSKKDRERNYDEFLCRLSGNPDFRKDGEHDDHSMFFCTLDCQHFWRTVPSLTLDQTDPNKGPDSREEDHCLIGNTEVLTPKGISQIDGLSSEGIVWTKDGWQPFVNLGMTAKGANVWRIELEGGKSFTATASHPVLCLDGRYRRVDELEYGCYIAVSEEGEAIWRSILKERRTGCAEDTIRGRARDFIGWCGSAITAPFQRAITSITRTMTEATTISPIWSFCRPALTSNTTPISPNASNTPSGTWKPACGQRPLSGMVRKTARLGIPSGQRQMRPFLRAFRSFVKSAASKVWRRRGRSADAPQCAMPGIFGARILGMTKGGRADVFNLHVPGVNNFVINGGIVVHNCYDETVYGLRSRPFMTTEGDREEEDFRRHMRRHGKKSEGRYAT